MTPRARSCWSRRAGSFSASSTQALLVSIDPSNDAAWVLSSRRCTPPCATRSNPLGVVALLGGPARRLRRAEVGDAAWGERDDPQLVGLDRAASCAWRWRWGRRTASTRRSTRCPACSSRTKCPMVGSISRASSAPPERSMEPMKDVGCIVC